MLNADAAGPSSKAGGGGRIPEYSPAELVQKWEEFFDAFDYAGRILSVADAYPETRTLEVRFDEVNRFDTAFAIHFLAHPQPSLVAGGWAVRPIGPPGGGTGPAAGCGRAGAAPAGGGAGGFFAGSGPPPGGGVGAPPRRSSTRRS